MFDFLFKHQTSNQEQNLKAASPAHKSIQVSLPEVANNWKRGRDGSVWLAPAMSSCLECPYLGSTQLHPLIPSHWADAVRTINLPGWVPCHVLTANPTPSPSTHSPPHHREAPPPRLKVMPIISSPLTPTSPWAHRAHVQTSDDCGKYMTYSVQEALHQTLWGFSTGVQAGVTVCVFRSVVAGALRLETGLGGGGQKTFFGSGTLTTKYPGAVSGTNSNKSFSKRTVVNSRGFFFFVTAYFRGMKGTFSSCSTNGSLDKEKRKEKTKRNKSIFSLHFASCEFSNYFNTKEKPLIKTLPRQ